MQQLASQQLSCCPMLGLEHGLADDVCSPACPCEQDTLAAAQQEQRDLVGRRGPALNMDTLQVLLELAVMLYTCTAE